MLSAADEEAIRARLRTYLDAFEAADAQAYADQFHFPVCIWANGSWIGIPDREACLRMCEQWVSDVREIGAVRGSIRQMEIVPLISQAAINRLSYQRLAPDGRAIEDVRACYTMLKVGDAWKIATVVGESEPVG